VSWCAEDDGSAEGGGSGADEVGCSLGVGGGSVCGGVGVAFVGVGAPGCCVCPEPPFAGADALAPADGEADGDADPPSASPLPFFPPCLPSAPAAPGPEPPPDTAVPPSAAASPCCPAECDGFAPLPPSSPTLIQPAAAATAMTVAARRTGTYKGRTVATSQAEGDVNMPNSRRPQEDTRGRYPYPRACSRASSIPKWWAISCTTVTSVSATTSALLSHIRSVGIR